MPKPPTDPTTFAKFMRRADAALQRAFPPALAVWVIARVAHIEPLPNSDHFALSLTDASGAAFSARVWGGDARKLIPALRVYGANSADTLLALQPRLFPEHGLQLVIRDCRPLDSAAPAASETRELALPAPLPGV